MYCAEDNGLATDWHYVHYGAHSLGGVGLIMLESVAVEKMGRISEQDLGIWSDQHIHNLEKIVNFAHNCGVKVGIQLAHAGRKSRVAGKIIAPSAIPFEKDGKVPHELTLEEINDVASAFAEGARRAKRAGFDVVEIHGGHGYLIHEFLSPLTNKRQDMYGSSLENRFQILADVINAVLSEWGKENALFLRISASDYAEGGINANQSVQISKLAKSYGVDVVDVSSGGLLPISVKSYPGYQVPFAEKIRKEAKIKSIAVGMIDSPEMAEEILQNDRADMVALARELLRNPHWPLLAKKKMEEEYKGPIQYKRAF